MLDRTYSVKEIAKLEKRRFRDEQGVFLVEGKKIIYEALHANAELCQILVTNAFLRQQQDFVSETGLDIRQLTVIANHTAQKLTDTKTPPGIFAVIKKPTLQLNEVLKNDVIVAIDGVRDPGNLGTMIRTADWFGVKGILISKEGVDPYNDKVLRATMGSIFHVQLYVSDYLAHDLEKAKKTGHAVVVSRPEVPSTFSPNEKQKICLVMGGESLGTSAEVDAVADFNFAIPRFGQAESLNVAMSMGIMLSQIAEKTFL